MAEQPQTMAELLRSVIDTHNEGRNVVIPTLATREFIDLSTDQRVIAIQMLTSASAQAMALNRAKPGDQLTARMTDHYYKTTDNGTARRLASYVEIIGSRMR